ncbi:MAG: sulfite reductase flavoprotein subunit alpha [Gammaproteobacteria bacterium]|nr:sulfite reductase flavoprotein subunit alpha [Gammaproteobacteria bacterium]
MLNPSCKRFLIQAHRWIALALAPLFLLILLTGAVLAFKPILDAAGNGAETAATAADPAAVAALLERVDPAGRARSVAILPDGRVGIDDVGIYDPATGERTGAADTGFDLFGTAERLHKDLLIGAGIVVEIATYGMLLIVAAGPFLAWPRLRRTLMGWHLGLGWALLPLALLLPLTGVLMTLHVGMGEMPQIPRAAAPIPLVTALERASVEADLGDLRMVRRFRGGTALVMARGTDGTQAYIVSDAGVSALDRSGNWPKAIHEGTWAGAWSGILNLAGAIGLAGLTLTGFLSWFRRRRQATARSGDADADILVAHASQTGTAARLAEATATALRRGGERVALASLGALDPRELGLYRHVLLLVSTTGEGEVPDPGRGFLARLAGARLDGVRFALFALGDSRYAHFCGGGETLLGALVAAGAEPALPMRLVDGAPAASWRSWLDSLAATLGIRPGVPPAVDEDRPLTVRLRERSRLDRAGDPGTRAAYGLVLETDGGVEFRPGDLLLVAPGAGEAERCYSIGSSSRVTPGEIRLSVSLVETDDAAGGRRFGAASGLLCRTLAVGGTLAAKLRRHPAFNPPAHPGRPIIMVAAGCGIAPFMGFLDELEADAGRGPTWLFFGNRRRDGDYFYGERLEALHADGVLTRLDTAFSRDQAERRYVTHAMVAAGAELVRWLLEEDALLYVCGRGSTLGRSVDEALARILAEHAGLDAAASGELLRQWQAGGRLLRDLFD